MEPTRKTRRSQPERSQEMRQRLSEATLDLLCEVGYERLSTQMIASRANVSRGAQTHHFPTKNTILLGALQHLLKSWDSQLREFKASSLRYPDPAEYTRCLWQAVFSQPRYMAVIELMLAARGDAQLRSGIQMELANWIDLRDQIFVQITGPDYAQADTSLLFHLNLCMLRGLALQASFNQDEAVNQRLLEAWIGMASREFKYLQQTERKT